MLVFSSPGSLTLNGPLNHGDVLVFHDVSPLLKALFLILHNNTLFVLYNAFHALIWVHTGLITNLHLPSIGPPACLHGPHKSMTLDAKAPVSPVDPVIHVFRLALVDIFMIKAT